MNRLFGSTLLVISTSLGISILALPFILGSLGISFTILLLMLAASIMVYTSLFILEINQWFPSGASYINMARKTLGKSGGVITWFLYLLFFYIVISAYLSGGSALIFAGMHNMSDLIMPKWVGSLVWVVIISLAILSGMTNADKVNRIFIIIFVLSFAIVFAKGVGHIQGQLLTGGNPHLFFIVMPIAMGAFTFHFLIPSLRLYLHDDTAKVRKVLLTGGVCVFVIYLLWLILIFGIVPLTGGHSFMSLKTVNHPTTILMAELQWLTGSTWLALCVRIFAFFTLICAFLGVSLSFFNFIKTSFTIKNSPAGKGLILGIIFVLPLLYTLIFPAEFFAVIATAGTFVVLIFALLPVLMVWSGRYVKGLSFGYTVRGGKVSLVMIILFTLFLLYLQIQKFV
jgi:tyrosine-specific transport protein